MQNTPTRALPYLTPQDKARDIPAQSKAIALELERLIDSGALDGEPGPRGLPGMNAIPSDDAVATYTNTPGTATRTAIQSLADGSAAAALGAYPVDNMVNTLVTTPTATRTALDSRYAPIGAVGGGSGGMPAGFVSVMSYGAVGNGVTNDAPAIQAALEANTGTIVFPPGKTFAIHEAIRPIKGNQLWCYGATILRYGDGGHMLRNYKEVSANGYDDIFPVYSGNGNIGIYGGTWDGDSGAKATQFNTFTFAHCTGITVRDATFIRNSTHVFDLVGADDVLIENCRFQGFALPSGGSHKEVIQIDSCIAGAASMRPLDGTPSRNVTVKDCYVSDYTSPTGYLGYPGRFVGSHSSPAAGKLFENIRVLNCEIEGTLSRGISAYGWNGFLIHGNRVRNTAGRGISISTPAGMAVTSGQVIGNEVTGNRSDYGLCVISEGTAAELANIQVFSNVSEASGNIGLVIGSSTNTVAGMNHVIGAATTNTNNRPAMFIGSGATDPYLYLNTACKSGYAVQALIGLSISAAAVRPRFVLNNLLNGLTLLNENTGSITT